MPFYFLNTALLAGAAAAVVPFLLHLMHRRRARREVLPTLRFLQKGLAANRRRMRLKHLLVLLLRVLGVLFIVAALSRPAYEGALFFREGSAPVSAVIVVDNSPSMAYKEAGRSRFERAKDLAVRAVDSLPPGSRAGLVVTGLAERGARLDREFTFDQTLLSERIRELEISAAGGDCTGALARAYGMIRSEQERGSETAGGEVYVATDLAAHAWRGAASLEPPDGTATFVLDAGSTERANFHISSAWALWRLEPSGRLEVTAEAASGAVGAPRVVELLLSSAKRAEKVVEIPAGSTAAARFEVSLLERGGGALQGVVRFADPDPLRADNSRYFTVGGAGRVSCLLVADRPGAGASLFLESALDPPGLEGRGPVAVETAESGRLAGADLSEEDAVVLAGCRDLSAAARAKLRSFLADGGGVLVFLPPEAGEGLRRFIAETSGCEVSRARRAPEGEPRRFESIAFDHAALSAFAGGRNGRLAAAGFYRWVDLAAGGGVGSAARATRGQGAGAGPAEGAESSASAGTSGQRTAAGKAAQGGEGAEAGSGAAGVAAPSGRMPAGAGTSQVAGASSGASVELARLSDGSSVLVASSVGRGRVVAAGFEPARASTDLVLRPAFVPFSNELVKYAAGAASAGTGGETSGGYRVGETVELRLPGGGPGGAVVRTSFGERTLEVSAGPESRGVSFAVYFPGNYIAELSGRGGERRVSFSVNLDPAESDLRRENADSLAAAIPASAVVTQLDDDAVRAGRGHTRGSREVYDLFLIAAVLVLVVECYVANRFYRSPAQG